MTNKLPWATAAVIIVIAAIGAWTIFGAAPAAPPAEPTPTPGWREFAWAWPLDNTGIENVYFMDGTPSPENDNMDNIDITHENIILGTNSLAVIMRNPVLFPTQIFTDNLNYNDNFYFIIRAYVQDDNVANVQRENIVIQLNTTGAFTIPSADENRTGDVGPDNLWLVDGSSEGGTEIQVNGVWDNDGNGYVMQAGDTLDVTVKLWLWK